MVNITSQDRVLVLYIPSNGNTPATGAQLGLIVRSTHDNGPLMAFTFHGWEVSGAFIKVCVERPEGLHEGEWEYTLRDADGPVLSQGLMMVGTMPADAASVQYNREIEYKEYGNE
jgi:hypothetical protein